MIDREGEINMSEIVRDVDETAMDEMLNDSNGAAICA